MAVRAPTLPGYVGERLFLLDGMTLICVTTDRLVVRQKKGITPRRYSLLVLTRVALMHLAWKKYVLDVLNASLLRKIVPTRFQFASKEARRKMTE